MKRTVEVMPVVKRKTEVAKVQRPKITEIPAVGELSTLVECDAVKFKLCAMRSSLLNWINRPSMPGWWIDGASGMLAKIEESLRVVEEARTKFIRAGRPASTPKKRREPSLDDLSWVSYPRWAETDEQRRFVAHVEIDKALAKNALRAAIRAALAADCDAVLDAIESVHEGYLDPVFFETREAAE